MHSSIAEQFLELRPRGVLARVAAFAFELAPHEIEILAERRELLVLHRLRPTLATLMSRAQIVMQTIQATTKVGAALRTTLAPSGIAGERPFQTAVVAMSRHAPSVTNSPAARQRRENPVQRARSALTSSP